MWIAVLVVGCREPPPPVDEQVALVTGEGPAQDAAQEALVAVRSGLEEAARQATLGETDTARATVAHTYRRHFEPLEGAIRRRDPKEALALEYDFGRLDAYLARGQTADFASEAHALAERIAVAVGP